MNKTLDAKFFVVSPDDVTRKRIGSLVTRELCEIYIIENYRIIQSLISQLEKCILILDFNTLERSIDVNGFLQELLQTCGGKLIRILTVDPPPGIISHDKLINYESGFIRSDSNVLTIVNELNIWGQRNYIRFGNKNSRIAVFRMKIKNNWRTGVIHDISASGMSCSFDKHSDIEIDEHSTDIELNIEDRIFSLTGSFLIRRTFKTANLFILIFSRKRSKENIRSLNSIIYKLTTESIAEKIRKLV